MKISQSALVQCGFKFVKEQLSSERLELFEQKIAHNRYYKFLLNGHYVLESERYEKEFDGLITDTIKIWKIKGRFGKHLWLCCYNSFEFFEATSLEDLLAICNEIYHNKNIGFVYVIKSDFGYKIGRTKNLDNRTRQFAVKLPFEWTFVKIYVLERSEDMERMSHELLAHKRINGEWFVLTDEDFQLLNHLHKCLLD